MSEAAAPASTDAAGSEAPKAAKRSGMLTKVIALVFMLTVVVTECLVGYVWFFSPSDAAVAAQEAPAEEPEAAGHGHGAKPAEAHGDGHGAHGAKPEAHGGHGGHGDSKAAHGGGHGEAAAKGPATHGEYTEVDLGKYNVMAYQPGANAMRVIEFHLYGAIASEDYATFERLWETNQQRCRDQVIVTIRSSDVEDFTDPGLGLIKRKILARTNDVLGKPLIEEVVFSDFSFIEE